MFAHARPSSGAPIGFCRICASGLRPIPASRPWRELRERGYAGGYTAVKRTVRLGLASRQEIFERFKTWMDELSGSELSRIWRLGRNKVDEIYSTLSWPGHLIDAALVNLRAEFDETLRQFVQANAGIFRGAHAELIAAALDLDRLTRPYVYANTPLSAELKLDVLKIVEDRPRGWVVESPYDFEGIVQALKDRTMTELQRAPTRILIDHDRGQVYRMPRRIQKEYWDECRMFAIEMGNHYPTWSTVRDEAQVSAKVA